MSVGSVGAGSGSSKVDGNRRTGGADSTGGVYRPVNVEEGQGLSRNVSGASSAAPIETTSPVAPSPTEKKEAQKPPERVSRQISEADISDQLIKLQLPLTKDNRSLVLTMLQQGIPVSRDNFDLIASIKNGASGHANDVVSAAIATAKGLAETPRAVDILSAFLNPNTTLSKQLISMQEAVRDLLTSVKFQDGILSTGLSTGLASVLADLDRQLRKLAQMASEKDMALSQLRGTLIRDLTTLSGFLNGINEKFVEGQPNAKDLGQQINKLRARISGFTESLTAQAIISKDSESMQISPTDRFSYWQIPNPLAQGKDIDILIRKDPTKKKGAIDESKTRMVMRLETEDLGEIAITMDIHDHKIWYIFNTDRQATLRYIAELERNLRERMEAINYNTMTVRSSRQKVDLKKLLIPVFNLDRISRISAEI